MSFMTDKIMNAEHVSEYSMLVNGNLTVEHAEIVWPNFSGRPTKANPSGGKQLFNLVLSEEMGARLFDMGWNIKVKEIRDNYDRDEQTMTVNWDVYDGQYRNVFDHALIYVEVIVNGNGDNPPTIYRASEYDGEKTMAPVPVDHWGDLDKYMMTDITVTVHPWLHGRNALKPDAKKPYLNTLIAKMQPVVNGASLGNTYSDYRVVGA